MADNRSRRAKLRAVIDPKSGATAGERENAQRFLDAMDAKPRGAAFTFNGIDLSNDSQTFTLRTEDVDEFLGKWKPGSSNGSRRGRPIVNVPTGVARSGGVTGTLEYGDALAAGPASDHGLTDRSKVTPIE